MVNNFCHRILLNRLLSPTIAMRFCTQANLFHGSQRSDSD